MSEGVQAERRKRGKGVGGWGGLQVAPRRSFGSRDRDGVDTAASENYRRNNFCVKDGEQGMRGGREGENMFKGEGTG